jgi:hypothetical protein
LVILELGCCELFTHTALVQQSSQSQSSK